MGPLIVVVGDVDAYGSISPGQAIRMWADGEGITEMDRVFVRSASLDGEAVVIFCKALCLVSHEELNPTVPHPEGISPRVFSLRKLVECAYYNLGRIRLIWGRLWSTISSHLVTASCHSDQTVAMYSVDSLRQLVGKLLSRDELANFTTQSDTLRPFVVVLKQCANVVVRELAVQCIEQAMNAHSSTLGSGWTVILDFLSVASLDPAPSVTRQCIDTLQSVVDVHWRKWGRGRDALADCVNIALRVARNPHNSDCSLRAIQLIHACAKELVSDLNAFEHGDILRSSSADYTNDDVPEGQLQRTSSLPNSAGTVLQPSDASPHNEPLLTRSALWKLIFESLVEIVNREDRRRCADLAAEILFKLPSVDFSCSWDQRTWNVFHFAIHRVFDLQEHAYTVESGVDRIVSYSTSFLPGLFAVITANYKTVGKSLLAHVLEILMGWMCSSKQAMALSGVYLLQEMIEEISDHLDEEGWSIVVGRLRCAWNLCASHGDAAEGDACPPFVSWIERGVPMAVSMIRVRCQVLMALQRAIHEIHAKLGMKMPKNLVPKLIDILLDIVKQTAEVNNNKAFSKRFSQHLETAAVSKTLEKDLANPHETPVQRQSHEEEIQEDIDAEIEPEHDSKELTGNRESEIQPEESGPSEMPALMTEFSQLPPIVTKRPSEDEHATQFPAQEDNFPELCTTMLPSGGCVFDGFLRLHVEGGMLTIDALQTAEVCAENCQSHFRSCL